MLECKGTLALKLKWFFRWKKTEQASRINGQKIRLKNSIKVQNKRVLDSLGKSKQADKFVAIILKKYIDYRGSLQVFKT